MKWVIVLVNLLVGAVLATTISALSVTDRQHTIEAAYRDAENLVNALAEHTRQTLGGIDLGLRTVQEALQFDEQGAVTHTDALHLLLRNRQDASATTYAYFVLDAQGRLVATSRTPRPEPADLSDAVEFSIHREGRGEGIHLGTPRLGRIGHARDQWIVNVTRRIETPDGRFAGIVAASMAMEQLQTFYDALRLGQHGVVGLFNRQGLLLARSPLDVSALGRDASAGTLFTTRVQRESSGRIVLNSPVDRVSRLAAFRLVPQQPAVVYVGLSSDEVLAPWRARAAVQGGIGLLAFALFALASTLTWVFIARRREWEQRRSQRLQLRSDLSTELALITDQERLLKRVTQAARELIGAHQAMTSFTREGGLAQAIHAVDLSDKYARWRHYDEMPNGQGIHRLVCEQNRPMFMTQAELEAHPAWRGFGAARERHPPMRGWLAVPLVNRRGANLGLIQLTDRIEGEFTQDDVHELVPLGTLAGALLDHLDAMHAREAALQEATRAKAEVETILGSISDAMYALDAEWRFTYLNAEAQRLLHRRREDLMGRNVWQAFPEAAETELKKQYQLAVTRQQPVHFEFFFPPLDAWFNVRAFPHERGLTVYFQDVTQRRQTEDRLRQAQRMDAIGQLTGGIAHDFNNLLTVILGSADDVIDHLRNGPPALHTQARLIRQAGERAAELTHRLLAFARRQPLNPRPTDVNALVGEIEGLLRRTLGENVHIELVRGAGLWRAVVDPGELQNALLNLALNARDAMPEGGRLTIETANAGVDSDYADELGVQAGQYVMVAVSDTGTGMSPEVVAQAFEPFFTTKGEGRGSGLGLSMVYGFARQSGGYVKLYSEPGEGTTVRLYLPRSIAQAEPDGPTTSPGKLDAGGERVLLVEDDPLVRRHTVNCLQRLGYAVAECEDGHQALARLDAGQRYDLLLTDVVLPGGLSGREVAAQALRRDARMKVLYMSGYTQNAIVHHGRLDPGVQLLSKPFRIAELARKLREVLG